MARHAPQSFDRFLTALHRRAVASRAAEQAGLGLLGGAGAAVGFTLLSAAADGAAPAGGAAALLGAGAAFGLFRGLVTRPSRLTAAARADEQLGTDDLLGTAAAVAGTWPDGGRADPWARAVLAIAGRRCATVPSSAVVLRRLGARAWGGIALSAVAALTLAAWVGPAGGRGDARAAGRPGGSVTAATADAPDRPLVVIAPEPRLLAAARGDPAEDAGNRSGPDDPNPTATTAPGAEPSAGATTAPAAADPPAGAGAADPAGGGSGGYGKAATRPVAPPALPDPPAAGPATRPGARGAAAATRPSAGGGLAAGDPPPAGGDTATGPSGHAGAAGGGAAVAAPPPPWAAAGWSDDVRAARAQLDAGRVPPAYRDLVRKYFEVE